MKRRTLLKLGGVSAAILLVAGLGAGLVEPGLRQGRLSAGARQMLASVARAMLNGTLPPEPKARDAALEAMLPRFETLVKGLPVHVQAELSQLVSLLCLGAGRRLLAGLAPDWPDASVAQVQQALQSMRLSRLAPRQQIYHGLHDIVGASYFSDASTWEAMGYPGPVYI